jgi:hypothetical protein
MSAVIWVVLVVLVIALFVAGMIMSLFGPVPGGLLGPTAFVAMVVLLGVLSAMHRRNKLPSLFDSQDPRPRSGLVLSLMIAACLLISLVSMVVLAASSAEGVADTTHPIFDIQETYRLNSHGTYTTVSRLRYLVVGSSFIIAWHTFGLSFILPALHLVLYGRWPSAFGLDELWKDT